MPNTMPAKDVLDREFLELRAKILEVAASLDRLDRGDGDVASDERFGLIRQGIKILEQSENGRAERVQLLFSLPYESEWRKQLDI